MTPLSTARVLEQFYLEARAKLLDLAAILDRAERGADVAQFQSDPRLEKVRQAGQSAGPGQCYCCLIGVPSAGRGRLSDNFIQVCTE